jgi:hypothetical protein
MPHSGRSSPTSVAPDHRSRGARATANCVYRSQPLVESRPIYETVAPELRPPELRGCREPTTSLPVARTRFGPTAQSRSPPYLARPPHRRPRHPNPRTRTTPPPAPHDLTDREKRERRARVEDKPRRFCLMVGRNV